MHVGQILLVDIDQHPDGADIGNYETLSGAGLNQLPRRHILLDDHAAYLAHWAKILKDRPSALLEASGHAQRAVDHLIAYSQAGSEAVAQAA